MINIFKNKFIRILLDKKYQIIKLEKGIKCSANFKFETLVTSMNELEDVLTNEKSLFFNDRVSPSAVIINFSFILILLKMKANKIWTIKKIKK